MYRSVLSQISEEDKQPYITKSERYIEFLEDLINKIPNKQLIKFKGKKDIRQKSKLTLAALNIYSNHVSDKNVTLLYIFPTCGKQHRMNIEHRDRDLTCTYKT